MSHSELPWEFTELTCKEHRGMGYLEDAHGNELASLGDSALWENENQANAALIVKAVNNHAQLLNDLKCCAEMIKDECADGKHTSAYYSAMKTIKQVEES